MSGYSCFGFLFVSRRLCVVFGRMLRVPFAPPVLLIVGFRSAGTDTNFGEVHPPL